MAGERDYDVIVVGGGNAAWRRRFPRANKAQVGC